MRIGVFAKTFPGTDPDQVLGACRAAGFSAAQYNMACSGLGPLPELIPEAAADQVRAAADARGVVIAALSATYNMTDPDTARRDTGRRGFAAIAGAAGHIGAPMVTVCTGSKDPADQWRHHPDNADPASWQEMCREFEAILPVAEQHGVMIGVEPEQANIVSSSPLAARLLDTFAGSRLRIVLDPANLLEGVPAAGQRRVIEDAFDLLGPMIALAHAKDRYPDGQVAPAGKGVVDWAHVVQRLRGCGFDGHLVAHGMSAAEAPGVAAFLAGQLEQG